MKPASRKEAYEADITYGTNNEFGFDYLRDNMVTELSGRVQGERAYAIVDEVDNILIDEARTPLIISGPAEMSARDYQRYAKVAPTLQMERDYTLDEKHRTVALTQDGISRLERSLNVNNLYAPENFGVVHHVENALKAHVVFQRDREYVVQDGEVIIVDEFTGRLMEGQALLRRASPGDRGQGAREDTGRVHHLRHHHPPELLQALRQTGRHDRHPRRPRRRNSTRYTSWKSSPYPPTSQWRAMTPPT